MSRRRAVILVGNPASPYSRAIRLGAPSSRRATRSRSRRRHEDGAPARGAPRRHRDLRRYPPSGRFAGLAASYGKRAARPSRPADRRCRSASSGRSEPASIEWFFWPQTVAWLVAHAGTELEPADLYHACGTLPIAAALAARERDRRGRAHVHGDLRRHRHHARVQQRAADPAARSVACWLDASGAGPARPTPTPRSTTRSPTGRSRHWRLGHPTDGRAQLPRAVDAAARPAPGPDPRRDRAAADDPDLPVLGPARTVRRARPGGRGGAPGARHGARAAGLRAGLGRRAWRATPSRATPGATSPCRPSTPTSCRRGSPRPTWP